MSRRSTVMPAAWRALLFGIQARARRSINRAPAFFLGDRHAQALAPRPRSRSRRCRCRDSGGDDDTPAPDAPATATHDQTIQRRCQIRRDAAPARRSRQGRRRHRDRQLRRARRATSGSRSRAAASSRASTSSARRSIRSPRSRSATSSTSRAPQKDEFALVDATPRADTLTELEPVAGGTMTVTKTGTGTPLAADGRRRARDRPDGRLHGARRRVGEVGRRADQGQQRQRVQRRRDCVGTTCSDTTLHEASTSPATWSSSRRSPRCRRRSSTARRLLGSVTGVVDYFFDYLILPRTTAEIGTGGTACPAREPAARLRRRHRQRRQRLQGLRRQRLHHRRLRRAGLRRRSARSRPPRHRPRVASSCRTSRRGDGRSTRRTSGFRRARTAAQRRHLRLRQPRHRPGVVRGWFARQHHRHGERGQRQHDRGPRRLPNSTLGYGQRGARHRAPSLRSRVRPLHTLLVDARRAVRVRARDAHEREDHRPSAVDRNYSRRSARAGRTRPTFK